MYLVSTDGSPKEIFEELSEAEEYVNEMHDREQRGIAIENGLDMDDDYERIKEIFDFEGEHYFIFKFNENELPEDGDIILKTVDGREEDEFDAYEIKRLIK